MTIPFSDIYYRVIIRNPSRTRTGEIQSFTKLILQPRYNDVGSWSMDIAVDHPQSRLLVPGAWLTFMAGNFEVCSGQLRGLKVTWSNSETGAGTLNAYGPTAEVVIGDRLIYQVPGSAATSQAAFAYDTRTGVGETIIKQWVDLNAGPSALATRSISGLKIEPDLGRGATITGSPRMDNLLTFIQPLAESAGLGFRVAFGTDDTMEFQMFIPYDRSGTAKFGRELGNLTSLEYVQEAPKSSDVVVGGSGLTTARIFRETIDSPSIKTWGARSETFFDLNNSADPVELDQAGTQEMVQNGPVVGLTIKTIDTPYLTFGIDYNLGDVVSVPEYGITDVLRGVDIDWSSGSAPQTTSTVGTWSRVGTPALIKALALLNAKIAALQVKK
jgi:hypothetical protein